MKISLALSFQSVFFLRTKGQTGPIWSWVTCSSPSWWAKRLAWFIRCFFVENLEFFWNLGHFFPALLQKTDLVRTLVVENYSLARFELNCRIISLHCSLILFCQVTLGRVASLCSIFKYFLSGLEMSRHCGLSWVSLQNNDFVVLPKKFLIVSFFTSVVAVFFRFLETFHNAQTSTLLDETINICS